MSVQPTWDRGAPPGCVPNVLPSARCGKGVLNPGNSQSRAGVGVLPALILESFPNRRRVRRIWGPRLAGATLAAPWANPSPSRGSEAGERGLSEDPKTEVWVVETQNQRCPPGGGDPRPAGQNRCGWALGRAGPAGGLWPRKARALLARAGRTKSWCGKTRLQVLKVLPLSTVGFVRSALLKYCY